jgi:hypothetical protein
MHTSLPGLLFLGNITETLPSPPLSDSLAYFTRTIMAVQQREKPDCIILNIQNQCVHTATDPSAPALTSHG